MQRVNALSKSLNNKKDLNSSNNIMSKSLLKFYADYREYVSLKYSSKYLNSIKTVFNHVFKYFGEDKFLNEIECLEWDKFFLHLNKISPGGAPVYLRTLKAALNKALEWNLIDDNKVSKIRLPKRQQVEQRSLKVNEMTQILEEVHNPQIRALIQTAFFTGLRRSELVNLKVKHVDLATGFLKVGDNDLITKSRKVREVALCSQVTQILKNIILNKKPEDLLFGKSVRFPFSADYVTRVFKKAAKRKRLDDRIHFHSLRHSYISHLANSEVPLPAVQMLAGHSSITTTMRYVHVNRDELMKSVSILDKIK